MRKRRSQEEMTAEPYPTMYHKGQLRLCDGVRSSFPDWRKSQFLDYRHGWTRWGDFFADGYFTRDEMQELVHARFGISV